MRPRSAKRSNPKRRRWFFILVAIFTLVVAPPAEAEEVEWLAPVDAEVADPFRAPSSPYGAGNRGLEYLLEGPTAIRAVDDGQVVFAGSVAGDLFVVIDHGNGLRSTLAYLSEISVVRGQHVRAGDAVAIASQGFHLTARWGEVYIDPAMLIAGVEIGVALVAGPAPAGGARVPGRRVGEPIARGRFDPPLAVLDSAIHLSPTVMAISSAEAAQTWYQQDCTPVSGGVATGPAGVIDLNQIPVVPDRILIQVAGLGSSSDDGSIGKLEPVALGYSADDVVGFSYNGGCIPQPFGVAPEALGPGALSHLLGPNVYQGSDTFTDIQLSALHLADLVEQAAAERPGASIDLVAHSLGGVVTSTALEILDQRGRSELLGTVMTIGSPHQGADLATIGSAAAGGLPGVNAVLPHDGEIRAAASVIQLSEVGTHSLDPPGPPPPGVNVVAVAGAMDPVVAAPAAIWDAATNVLVPSSNPISAHGDLPGLAQVREAFLLARSGFAPACVGLGEVIVNSAAGAVTAAGEDLVTVAAGIANWLG
ncbi:MAG: peptidoglycan DD-metalloendopeptidase family protein [Acidimicrobiales bacterium]|nr:peptidoglycan DD-metalloendopeptidase family protein [Acidimicrobiales bacterium]